jgi:hypothetical protein
MPCSLLRGGDHARPSNSLMALTTEVHSELLAEWAGCIGRVRPHSADE